MHATNVEVYSDDFAFIVIVHFLFYQPYKSLVKNDGVH